MSRTPHTVLAALLVVVLSTATAASATARPWPGDPVPDALPGPEVVDPATTGTPALWLLLVVAAATALVVGTAAYVAGSRRPQQIVRQDEPSLEVSEAALG
jgi:hypothetical protein